jgi:FlaA1/EpsC-like NDP-sugar epimerase
MIRLGGHSPDADIPIVYTGLRPGEKLFEELFHEQEDYQPTAHPKIVLARARECSRPVLESTLNEMQQAVLRFDEPTLERLLRDLVPEFSHEGDTEVVPLHRVRN